MSDSLNSELSRIFGFYDFVGSPTVISPWHSNNLAPGITEVHESLHRDLANTTTTGLIAKIVRRVLSLSSHGTETLASPVPLSLREMMPPELKTAILPPTLRRAFEQLNDTLMRAMFDVHEAVANYLSLRIFVAQMPDAAASFAAQLPESYKRAVAMVEPIFGRHSDCTVHFLLVQVPLLATAKVALSPPCTLAAEDLRQADRLRQFLRESCVTVRFQDLLKALLHSGELARIVDHCQRRFDQLVPGDWKDSPTTPIERRSRAELESEIRSLRALAPALHVVSAESLEMITAFARLHGIESTTNQGELISDIDRLLGSWRGQLVAAGVHTLDEVMAGGDGKNDDRDPLVSDTNYAVPAGFEKSSFARLMPKDTALKFRFEVRSEDQLGRILDKAQTLPCRVFVNLLLPVATTMQLAQRPSLAMGYLWARSLHAYSPRERRRLDIDWQNPFQILLPFSQVLRALCEPKRPNLSLKIDERSLAVPDIQEALLSTGYAVFVTAYDTSGANLLRVARSCARRYGAANISVVPLGDEGSNVVLISNNSDRTIWASPLSVLGWNQLYPSHFLPEPDKFKVNAGFPAELPGFGNSIDLGDLIAGFIVSTFALKKENVRGTTS